ncbi:hybrid sensor histidine kinase/response regulator [Thalassotalea insulae]|uniref:histidine kinase n=1 Tax=Thalassotalea insulae TaxID=2056778 RepID=A0ABQ6GWT1_9GAMM|nr:hybrid sensor histidine kinase/response regulator [Thalassotalea insulae]GLX80403.1 hybrid sensor histidine kinase/response regulator [Thalassotalea insulae]
MDEHQTLLIVDDNPTNIDLLRRYLEQQGYRISAVTSGETALKLAANLKPDLILLDVLMPGIDGFETCSQLKASSATQDIPIIFVTAKVAPEDLRKGFSVGGADYITKPVEREVLLARVGHQLSISKKRLLEQELLEQNRAMAALGEMVASITHEVSTPLGNLKLSVSMLKDNLELIEQHLEQGNLKKQELLDFIHEHKSIIELCDRNSIRADQLMTSFKNIAVGQCNLTLDKFNLKTLLNDIVLTLHPKIKRTAHQVNVNLTEPIYIYSYSGTISQVITNLINNALMHAFNENDQGVVDIDVTEQQDKIIIKVTDNGMGIPAEQLSKIFDKFYTTKANKGGTGLGLYISRGLVENELKGEIAITSTLGQGTSISLILPSTLND